MLSTFAFRHWPLVTGAARNLTKGSVEPSFELLPDERTPEIRLAMMVITAAGLLFGGSAEATESKSSAGALLYQQHCESCHGGGITSTRAPTRETLRALTPESIVHSLASGKMALQGAQLSDLERHQVAEFLSSHELSDSGTHLRNNKCSQPHSMEDVTDGPAWNGWGRGITNARYQSLNDAGLTPEDISKLKLKWAFGFADVSSVRMQPSVVWGRLFVTSDAGIVYALDPQTGCEYWSYRAQAGVRTAISVGMLPGTSTIGAFFGDEQANVYALDAETGQQLWIRKVEAHAAAALTGSPTLHAGRLFVPIQGVREEVAGGSRTYPCCTFRGSLVALHATSGEVLWKTYTVEEPKPRQRNANGVQMWGPAGGGIWSAPTLDLKRNLVYAATGNGYAGPSQPMTNAVIAFDIDTGTVRWVRQVTHDDTWAAGCIMKDPDPLACPAKLGPDHDFSAPPALVRDRSGRDLIVLPQKSGTAWALDPDRSGEIVWKYQFGQGTWIGGQWGAASDFENAYFGVSDLTTPKPGGIRAVNLSTGALVWSMPPQPPLCAPGPGCTPAQGSAVTVIPGAVFSGAADGALRAYSTKDGSILWQFNTAREFPTVNAVPASGGGIDGAGPVIINRMLFLNSGYGGYTALPGNVLLAFGL